MLAALCTNVPNTSAAIALEVHTTPPSPAPNIGCTVTNPVIHKPIAALAARRRTCPQTAQALILVLRSLHRFFFEEQPWGRRVSQHPQSAHPLGLSAFAISFQDGRRSSTVVIRLPLWTSWRMTCPRRLLRGPASGDGRLAAGFEFLVGEGTLWTWRRQVLASPT